MNKLKRWWNSVSGKLSLNPEQAPDPTARELCRMMKRCPMCSGEFEDHSYAHFAVTILADHEAHRALDFIDACEDHRWEDARRYQEFDHENDALVAYAMRCNTGRVSLLMERSPFEEYELDRLFSCNVLDVTSGEKLERMVAPNDWRRLHWI